MNTGSPIAARMGLDPLVVLVVAVILLSVMFLLWLLSKKLDSYHNSNTFAEKNKDKPTTSKDIINAAKKAKLTKQEKDILHAIFKAHPLPNISFALKENEIMEPYFKEQFLKLDADLDEPGKTNLFSLRTKLVKTFESSVLIKNSRLIPLDTVLTYTPSQGIHKNLTLIESAQEEFHLLLPSDFAPEEKPEILSKIKLILVYKNSNPYEMEARVVRYQKGKNNSDIMVCGQTDRIFERQKRTAPRIDLNIACTFASVKTEKVNNRTDFKVSEKLHEGVLADSSAGGCRIFTKLPIKAEQFIYIKGPLDGASTSDAIGQILRTTKNKHEEYILHIKFVKIDGTTVNRINAVACHYQN